MRHVRRLLWWSAVLCVAMTGVAQAQVSSVANRNLERILLTGPGDALGKQEDTAHASGDAGVMALGVRNDTRGTLAGTNLDYAPLQLNASGDLRVAVTTFQAAAIIDTENTGLVADTLLEAATVNMRLMSATAQENAGTPANTFAILRHGIVGAGVCTGNVIAYIKLGPSQSWSMSWGPRGLAVASGVCLDWISGTIDVNIATVVESAP